MLTLLEKTVLVHKQDKSTMRRRYKNIITSLRVRIEEQEEKSKNQQEKITSLNATIKKLTAQLRWKPIHEQNYQKIQQEEGDIPCD